ncbi:MAG: hypothetical protein ABSC77_15190 [Terracidiphilus sp.]|jgi:hypothetical protein
MATKCEKKECEKEALNKIRFTDSVYRNVDTDYPVCLCEEHTKEVQKVDETDVAGVKKWLKAIS